MSSSKQENNYPLDFENVPHEVMEIWILEYYNMSVGENTYNRLLENKKKYSEWFPKKKIN